MIYTYAVILKKVIFLFLDLAACQCLYVMLLFNSMLWLSSCGNFFEKKYIKKKGSIVLVDVVLMAW